MSADHRRNCAKPRSDAPTPIWITPRTRTVLVLAGVVALALLVWWAPSVLTLAIGGLALALVLSFPVRLLEHVMPRWLAITLSILAAVALVVVALVYILPIFVEQLGNLVDALPGLTDRLGGWLRGVAGRMAERGWLSVTPERFLDGLSQNLRNAVGTFTRRVLGGLGQFVGSLVSIAVSLFGILFLAIYFLADARQIEATALRATPSRYRPDVRALWDAFRYTLSRYIGGLGISLAIQGVLSAVGLYVLDVPYALLCGVWVSVTALVPYLGAWIGAIPAVLLAFTVSPRTVVFTAVLYLGIQQLEGNVLTPRIQGKAVNVHPILVFLAVVAGGALFGIPGVLLAVNAARAEAWAWLRVPIVLLVVALLVAALYRYGSSTRVPFRRVLPGAALAAVGWTLMSLAFSAALATVLDYGATYGSFGAAIALLVYLLLSAVVALLGAEVNAVLADAVRVDAREGTHVR